MLQGGYNSLLVLFSLLVAVLAAYTSLEMAGCSVTVMRLTPLLKRLMLAPADSPAFVQV